MTLKGRASRRPVLLRPTPFPPAPGRWSVVAAPPARPLFAYAVPRPPRPEAAAAISAHAGSRSVTSGALRLPASFRLPRAPRCPASPNSTRRTPPRRTLASPVPIAPGERTRHQIVALRWRRPKPLRPRPRDRRNQLDAWWCAPATPSASAARPPCTRELEFRPRQTPADTGLRARVQYNRLAPVPPIFVLAAPGMHDSLQPEPALSTTFLSPISVSCGRCALGSTSFSGANQTSTIV